MKPTLQLKLGQQLAMTPQLQQAIRLLQLSTLDLQQEIQEALESNPLLEHDEGQEQEATQHEPSHDKDADAQETATASADTMETSDAFEKNEMPDDLPVDTTWDHLYSAGTGNTGAGASGYDDQPVYQGETTQTLYDYLEWQLELTPFSEN
ncbi:RNA polymerase factor sigma-54, partial [Halorubrum sp. ARQ200]